MVNIKIIFSGCQLEFIQRWNLMTHGGAQSGRLGLRLSSGLLMLTWFMVMTWQ